MTKAELANFLFEQVGLNKREAKHIIDLYNSQKGPERPEYPTTSLGNKSLEKVVSDIAELLNAPRKASDVADKTIRSIVYTIYVKSGPQSGSSA